MTVLNHAARRFHRATYTPRKPTQRLPIGWAALKYAIGVNLGVDAHELARLREHPDLLRDEGAQHAINAITATVARHGTAVAGEDVALFADVQEPALASVVEALGKIREDDLASFREFAVTLSRAYEEPERLAPHTAGSEGAGWSPGGRTTTSERASAQFLAGAMARPVALRRQVALGDGGVAAPPFSLAALLEWGMAHGIHESEGHVIEHRLGQVFASPASVTPKDFETWALSRIDRAWDLAAALKHEQVEEPTGFLHLERLHFIPAGIERGELIHSVPLSPGEEVNIAHREWSNTSEEFSRIVTDFMEAFSEEGVTEKSDIAQSTNSQEQHTSGFNTGVTASGGYGPVNVTSSLSVNVSDSASQSAQTAMHHSQEVTKKASARSRKEHKVSFKVASAAGTEDQEVRKLKNPFSDRATRVDYYQLLRKWRVELYRYGIRLTFDLTVPEPGGELLSKIKEIDEINSALDLGFGETDDKSSPAFFGVTPDQLTDSTTVNAIAAQYGAPVDPPFPQIEQALQNWINPGPILDENANRSAYQSVAFEIPQGFFVKEAKVVQFDWEETPGHKAAPNDAYLWIIAPYPPAPYTDKTSLPLELPVAANPISDWQGNPFQVVVKHKWIYTMEIIVDVIVRMTDDAFRSWQAKSWQTIREAAQARYEEHRQYLKQRLERLQGEIGAQDSLSLRKIEREEVMKNVLRWMFGPTFEFSPKGLPKSLYALDEAVTIWGDAYAKMRAQGDVIQFLHHAIEWENMLYILYPYFWSRPHPPVENGSGTDEAWKFKKYLDHPDPMHRTFLKSGAARVVLTIRPGFEKEFLSYLHTGKKDGLPDDSPYLDIATEMKDYAQTHYPGVPDNTPPDDADAYDAAEQGELISSWYEYTPTSALSVGFDEELPEA